jgi:hypothetical protein
LAVAHTSVGVETLTPSWQMPQPESVRPVTAEWIAATFVPPVWQPLTPHPAAAAATCEVSTLPCMGIGEVPAWQLPCAQVNTPFAAEFAGVGWHVAQLLFVPSSPCAT